MRHNALVAKTLFHPNEVISTFNFFLSFIFYFVPIQIEASHNVILRSTPFNVAITRQRVVQLGRDFTLLADASKCFLGLFFVAAGFVPLPASTTVCYLEFQ